MPERRSYGRLLVVLAVAVADLALIGWAVTAHRSPSRDELRAGPPAAVPDVSTPSPSAQPSGGMVATRRAIPISVAHGAAVRAADPGSCSGGHATVQWSSDGGVHWRAVSSPAALVLRVRVTAAQRASLIGTTDNCRLAQWSTRDGGADWQAGDVSGNWSLEPQLTARTLQAPSGPKASPCARGTFAVDLVGVSAGSAVLLCSGGDVLRTTNSAASWQKLGAAPTGAVALGAAGTDRALVLARGVAGCSGLAVVPVGGGSTIRGGCLTPGAERAGLSLSSVTDGVASVGSSSTVTHDGGRSFS